MSQVQLEFSALDLKGAGLRIGVQVTGPQDSWVRFSILSIPLDYFHDELIGEIRRRREVLCEEDQEDEPLW